MLHPTQNLTLSVLLTSLALLGASACAPASSCELGENADGTCRLFVAEIKKVGPFATQFNADGAGAQFVSAWSIGDDTVFGVGDEEYRPIAKPGVAGVAFFANADGDLEGAYDVPMGNLAEWGNEYRTHALLNSKILNDGALLLFGATGESNWAELQNPPVDGVSTTYNNQHLTVIDRDGSVRFHRLLGYGDIGYRHVFELEDAILISGTAIKEGLGSVFLGDRNRPEYEFDETSRFWALFDKTTGEMKKVVLWDGFGINSPSLNRDGRLSVVYVGIKGTSAFIENAAGERTILNPQPDRQVGGMVFLNRDLEPQWYEPFEVVDESLYNTNKELFASDVQNFQVGLVDYLDGRFDVLVPPGATFKGLRGSAEQRSFITDLQGEDLTPQGFFGARTLSLGDGSNIRYAYSSDPLTDAQISYLGYTREEFQRFVEYFGEGTYFTIFFRHDSDGTVLGVDFCDLLSLRSSIEFVANGFATLNWINGGPGNETHCYYAGRFLNQDTFRQYDGLDPDRSYDVQVNYRFY